MIKITDEKKDNFKKSIEQKRAELEYVGYHQELYRRLH